MKELMIDAILATRCMTYPRDEVEVTIAVLE
jgi:hypothetical protein